MKENIEIFICHKFNLRHVELFLKSSQRGKGGVATTLWVDHWFGSFS